MSPRLSVALSPAPAITSPQAYLRNAEDALALVRRALSIPGCAFDTRFVAYVFERDYESQWLVERVCVVASVHFGQVRLLCGLRGRWSYHLRSCSQSSDLGRSSRAMSLIAFRRSMHQAQLNHRRARGLWSFHSGVVYL